MKRIFTGDFLLAGMMVLLLGISLNCKKNHSEPSPSGPGTNEIWMQNNTFNPSAITVSANTTLKWINKDGSAHTVDSNTGLFNSGNINNGGTYSYQFSAAGTFSYHCGIHSQMTGSVTVQ